MARIPKSDIGGEETMFRKECQELWENGMYNKEMILYQDEERVVVFEDYAADIREATRELLTKRAEEYLTEKQKEEVRSKKGVPVVFEK
jgi:hypothetical protein